MGVTNELFIKSHLADTYYRTIALPHFICNQEHSAHNAS